MSKEIDFVDLLNREMEQLQKWCQGKEEPKTAVGCQKLVEPFVCQIEKLKFDNYNKDQRIAELEEQLKNAVILEPDHYVIITNGWKNKKYGVALSQQRVQYNYIQETDGRMGCYVPCIEFGKFETKAEALAKLEELKGEIE